MKLFQKLLLVVFISLILVPPAQIVFSNSDKYFSRSYDVRYKSLKKLYFSSQYMIKKNPGIITDEVLEAYASGAFIRGTDPILLVHDQPPLGRYLVGLSIIVFNNENTFSILFFAFSLFGIFLIAKEVLKNTLYSLLPVVIFANEPLMHQKIVITPLLELTHLPFIVFSIYFFLRMIKNKAFHRSFYAWAILTSLSLGFVISIRFFVLGGAILLSFILFFIIKKRFMDMFSFFLTLPLALFVLWFSYIKTVIDFHSVIKPFSVQKYIYVYQSSKFMLPFTVWDLLMFNRWHTWWADRKISSDPNWVVLWPISTILSFILIVLGVIRKTRINDPELVVLLWTICYGVMLSTGAVSTRYFLPWVPALYILAFSCLFRLKLIKKIFS